MGDVIKLTPVGSTQQVQQSVIDALMDALEQAKAGTIAEVILLITRPDGDVSDMASATMDFPRAIGQLELTKQDWISQFTRDTPRKVK